MNDIQKIPKRNNFNLTSLLTKTRNSKDKISESKNLENYHTFKSSYEGFGEIAIVKGNTTERNKELITFLTRKLQESSKISKLYNGDSKSPKKFAISIPEN